MIRGDVVLYSRKRANQKWLRENYESITIRVPKGTKEQIKTWADACGLSMASYIKEACREKGEKKHE
nr:MAG TPA: Alginate and motility regulator [Caudoviricetes sp.]